MSDRPTPLDRLLNLQARPRSRSGNKSTLQQIDKKTDVINHFWICLDLFQHGLLPMPPECELSLESLKRLAQKFVAAHSLTSNYFKKINYEEPQDATLTFQEWKAVAMEDLKLSEVQLEMHALSDVLLLLNFLLYVSLCIFLLLLYVFLYYTSYAHGLDCLNAIKLFALSEKADGERLVFFFYFCPTLYLTQ
jgi:hypothetical protein